MIHRALFGSIERFFGVLLEHYAGAFPAWLAPVQVVGIPIGDAHVPYLQEFAAELRSRRACGSRSTPPTTGCRRRSATRQKQKVPFMVIAGDEDMADGHGLASATATARRRTASRCDEAPARSLATIRGRVNAGPSAAQLDEAEAADPGRTPVRRSSTPPPRTPRPSGRWSSERRAARTRGGRATARDVTGAAGVSRT